MAEILGWMLMEALLATDVFLLTEVGVLCFWERMLERAFSLTLTLSQREREVFVSRSPTGQSGFPAYSQREREVFGN